MPLILPPSFLDQIEQPHDPNRLLWLVELIVVQATNVGATVTPGIMLRLIDYHVAVTWPAVGGNTWSPFNFTFTPIEQGQEGDLPSIDLSIDNSTRLLMAALHEPSAFLNSQCTVNLVPETGLGLNPPEFQQWKFRVASAAATDESVTFRLEQANFFAKRLPQDRYVASRCRWTFGGNECGYPINTAAAYTTCPKTVEACIARGLDEQARALPVLHPARYGGFPGIPKQR